MMDELELISRLREEVPLGSADRAEHAFLAAIRPPATSPGTVRRRRTTAIITAAVTAAGLAAGLTLLTGNSTPPGNTSGASPTAAQLLAKIAAAAAAQPNPPVSDSQFVYLATWGAGSVCKVPSAHSHSGHAAGAWDCVPGKPTEVQYWYPVSSLCATGEFLMNGKMTKFSYKAAAADPKTFPCNGNLNYPTYRFMQMLPTNPQALLSFIQQTMQTPAKAGRAGAYWAFFTIGTLLYNAPPPPVTAALYRAAALIPGVTVIPDATDTIGRPGVAVAFTYQGMLIEWIFSKQTYQYLGSREVNTANGTLISQQAIQQHAIVDHAGQFPG
jgi:hypothetical protein